MEILLPALDELVQLYSDKVSKLGDTILFTCIKYERIDIEFCKKILSLVLSTIYQKNQLSND
jgi:hypothetical protein